MSWDGVNGLRCPRVLQQRRSNHPPMRSCSAASLLLQLRQVSASSKVLMDLETALKNHIITYGVKKERFNFTNAPERCLDE